MDAYSELPVINKLYFNNEISISFLGDEMYISYKFKTSITQYSAHTLFIEDRDFSDEEERKNFLRFLYVWFRDAREEAKLIRRRDGY